MLRQLLYELENAPGALDMEALSKKMGARREMLEVMLDTLVRQGRLQEKSLTPDLSCASCGEGCSTRQGCNLRPVNSRVFFLNSYKKGQANV